MLYEKTTGIFLTMKLITKHVLYKYFSRIRVLSFIVILIESSFHIRWDATSHCAHE